MGMVQSIFCAITFCVERVLTWACCAFLLMLLMFVLVLMMAYGITVGYHYAQKELAIFALESRPSSTMKTMLRDGGDDMLDSMDDQPIVRLLAVNETASANKRAQQELHKTEKPDMQFNMDKTETNLIIMETQRPPEEPTALSPHERELAKRLIGRFRRSKNITTEEPLLRPLRPSTEPTRTRG